MTQTLCAGSVVMCDLYSDLWRIRPDMILGLVCWKKWLNPLSSGIQSSRRIDAFMRNPNSSNADSRTHNELVTLLAVLKSYFSQIKGSSERISEARSNCCHLALQY